MKMIVLSALLLVMSATATAESPSASATELQALHAKWFTAFDEGDGATMDQMEVPNLVLVMPTGMVWAKDAPRGAAQQKHDSTPKRSLGDVVIRQHGETAILTGTLTTIDGSETDKAATTVVFVRAAGKWLVASAQWTPIMPAK